jgi:4-amino-4-deoxy-L-arabinose transferase-like glycosyltransferase
MEIVSDRPKPFKWLVFIVCIGLVARILMLRFATTDSSDPISRTWIGWIWLSDPEFITHGVWGPLHFYLIAFSMAIFEDPMLSPILLNFAFSAFTPVLLFYFTRIEFGNERAALIVAASYAFYPVAVNASLMATEVPPFIFLLVLCMVLLSIARQDRGSWRHAVGAGIGLTFASMLRYEAWMLIPFFGILLWRKPKIMILFFICSILHPIFWMIGNGIHYGDPLYSISYASNWELNVMESNQNLSPRIILNRIRFYPLWTLNGLTPIVAACCISGAVLSLTRRRSYSVWLIPFLGVLCLFIISATRGSLALKTKYTVTLGTMLFPFSAELFKCLSNSEAFQRTKQIIVVFIIISMVFFSYPDYAIPGFGVRKEIKSLSLTINSHLGSDDPAFICDFFGWGRTHYIALSTRLHPSRIFVAPGGRNQQLNEKRLADWVMNHKKGLLLIRENSRLAQAISSQRSNQAKIGDVVLILRTVEFSSISNENIRIYHYQTKLD